MSTDTTTTIMSSSSKHEHGHPSIGTKEMIPVQCYPARHLCSRAAANREHGGPVIATIINITGIMIMIMIMIIITTTTPPLSPSQSSCASSPWAAAAKREHGGPVRRPARRHRPSALHHRGKEFDESPRERARSQRDGTWGGADRAASSLWCRSLLTVAGRVEESVCGSAGPKRWHVRRSGRGCGISLVPPVSLFGRGGPATARRSGHLQGPRPAS